MAGGNRNRWITDILTILGNRPEGNPDLIHRLRQRDVPLTNRALDRHQFRMQRIDHNRQWLRGQVIARADTSPCTSAPSDATASAERSHAFVPDPAPELSAAPRSRANAAGAASLGAAT